MKKYLVVLWAICTLATAVFARTVAPDASRNLSEIRQRIQAAIQEEVEKEPDFFLRDPLTEKEIPFWEAYRHKLSDSWDIEYAASLKSPFKMSSYEARMMPFVMIGSYFHGMNDCPEDALCHYTTDDEGGKLIFIMTPDTYYRGEWDLHWRYIDIPLYRLTYDFGYHTTADVSVSAFEMERWMNKNPFKEVIPFLRDKACEGF